jgi:hypothetical protein
MNPEALSIKDTCKNFPFYEIHHASRPLFISTGMFVKVDKLRILSGVLVVHLDHQCNVYLCVELHVFSINNKQSST